MVIPFFNERDYVPLTSAKVCAVLQAITDDYEVILVDDGSTDGSAEIASALARQNPRIRLVSHQSNQGLGRALRTGFGAATRDLVVYTDMDMPFELDLLREILPLMESCDFLFGKRTGPRESGKRQVLGTGYNVLVRLLFGVDVKDVNFALKVFRREILKELDLQSQGSFIDAELYLGVIRLKKRVKSVEVAYQPREFGVSSLANWRNIARILREMLSEFRRRGRI